MDDRTDVEGRHTQAGHHRSANVGRASRNGRVSRNVRQGVTWAEIDRRVAAIAAEQHGVITWHQLLAAGDSPARVKYRARIGLLRRLHRGVYMVGFAALPLTRAMAAVLSCGAGARLSHRSAAVTWNLLSDRDGPVHVTVVGRDPGPRPGVRVHRVARLPSREVTRFEGIPITTVPRTVLDLAATVRPRELEQALARAERDRLTTRAAVRSLVEKYPRRRGTARLRILLREDVDLKFTRSNAEDRLLAMIEGGGLPGPKLNVRVAGEEVDFFWPEERVVVEVDGFAYHSSRDRFEGDRLRDANLAAADVQVVRVTWRQLMEQPNPTLVRIAQALAVARSRRALLR